MLELKEVTYLYRLCTYSGKVEEIRATGGYARLDYVRGYYWHPFMAPSVIPTPWHFLKEDSTLYLMREEPNFYA